ncbi:MAG: hypothetical protein QOK44_5330 [Betaproteobacteria bacterium]|nr:hypothetical protein [Betaproteobacteria bacterium]
MITKPIAARTQLKGMIMKQIARTLLVVSLATTAVAAFAAPPSGPSSAQETTSLWSEFPNMRTYADSHRNDAIVVSGAPVFPSSANETTSLAEEGLVPRRDGGSKAYAGVAQPARN